LFLHLENFNFLALLQLFLRKLLSFEDSNQDINKVDAFQFVKLGWLKWLVGLVIVFCQFQHTGDHSGGKGSFFDEL
jgi:hypothetical protein